MVLHALRVDPADQTVSLASAGHFPPYLLRQANPHYTSIDLDPDMPLGVTDGVIYTCKAIELGHAPCTLLCYTDGVTEAMDSDSRLFSASRVIDVLNSQTDLQPQHIITCLREAMRELCGPAPQSDDITMLAINLT